MTDPNPAEQIRSHVAAHYEATPDRLLYLAQLGSWLSVSKLRPSAAVRVSEWLSGLLAPDFTIVVDPANPVRRAVVPTDRVEWAREVFRLRSASMSPAHVTLSRIPKSMLLAFLKRLEAGQRIFVESHPPFKHQISTEAPGQDWIEVPPSFRIEEKFPLSDTNALSSEQADILLGAVRHWCESIGRSVDSFTPEETRHRVLPDQDNALQRLIRAQPMELRSKMFVPMDIVELLLRHK